MKINSELTVEVVALGWDEAWNREKELHRQAECSVLLEHPWRSTKQYYIMLLCARSCACASSMVAENKVLLVTVTFFVVITFVEPITSQKLWDFT
jgi:hypothetical protein